MVGRAPQTTATTLPAPIGGLNDRDPIANMPPTDAVLMDNWWPEPGRVSVRKGSITHADGLPGDVETLFEYCPPSGTIELFAGSGDGIYNVTASGTVGSAAVSSLTSARFQTMAATTAGGSFLYAFNGLDEPLLYDGSTWKSINGTSSPAITGITDTKTIIDGLVFKGRAYLVQKNSMSLWYLPPASIGGEAKEILMGQIFQRGGHIVTTKSWTIDSGAGQDDHLVVISSNGEVAVFSGYDPSAVGTWSLVGVFYLGRPIGQRCAIKFGGDLLIICEDGVFPLGAGLLSASVDRRVALTDKIQNSIRQAANTFKSVPGWELTLASDYSALILNIPGSPHYQFLQNTLTGAWTKFNGWAATSWIYSELGLFFGENGKVKRAWFANNDDGESIQADCLQAFNHFGSMAQSKYFTMIRPYIATGGRPSILYTLNGDYMGRVPDGVLSTYPPDGMIWGSMIWGSMIWGGSLRQVQDWLTVGGIYKSAGLRLKVQNNQSEVQWAATDFIFTKAGLL